MVASALVARATLFRLQVVAQPVASAAVAEWAAEVAVLAAVAAEQAYPCSECN